MAMRSNPRLMGAWAGTLVLLSNPLLAQNANVFTFLTEIQSPHGLILADLAGFAYGYKCWGSIDLKRANSRLSCLTLVNPDHDVRIQMSPQNKQISWKPYVSTILCQSAAVLPSHERPSGTAHPDPLLTGRSFEAGRGAKVQGAARSTDLFDFRRMRGRRAAS